MQDKNNCTYFSARIVTKYYKILGLLPNASKAEIKKAYRKQAMKYHPDVNKDANATEKFVLINEAYDFLMNPKFKYKPKQANRSSTSKQDWYDKKQQEAREKARKMARETREFMKEVRRKETRSEARRRLLLLPLGYVFFIVLPIFPMYSKWMTLPPKPDYLPQWYWEEENGYSPESFYIFCFVWGVPMTFLLSYLIIDTYRSNQWRD